MAMIENKTVFYSDGCKLDASFYLPDEGKADPEKPLVLVCSGFLGLKDFHPARFARALTAMGYPCFGFDYRGFGESEGERHTVVIENEIRDIVNAAVFAMADDCHQGQGLLLMGWGMGGGLIFEAAQELSEVRGLVAINGFYDARRVQREVRGSQNWRAFQEMLLQERLREVQTGEIRLVDAFEIYPLDPASRAYVDAELRVKKGFWGDIHFTFAYSLLRFCPEGRLEGLEHLPLLLAHGDSNDLHPPTEAESLFRKYPGQKELYWIPKAGHTEWMFDDHPTFTGLVEWINAWVARTLS